jgi:phage shock protein A
MSGLSDASAFDAFNRMAEKIEDNERRLLAESEVDQALALPTVESEFLKLEAGASGVAARQSPRSDDRPLDADRAARD